MSEKTSEWEWVRGSKRNKPYIRKVPWCRKNPTLWQRKVRYQFAKISHENTGRTGLVEHGNKEIPAIAHQVAKELKGKKFAPPKPQRIPEILDKLKLLGEKIGRQVESTKPINSTVIPRLLQLQRLEEQRKKKEAAKKKAIV